MRSKIRPTWGEIFESPDNSSLLYFQLQAVGVAVAVRDAPRFDHLHDAGRFLRRLLLRVGVDLPEYSDGRLRHRLHHDARLLPGARRGCYRRDRDDLPGALQGINEGMTTWHNLQTVWRPMSHWMTWISNLAGSVARKSINHVHIKHDIWYIMFSYVLFFQKLDLENLIM